jgi:predicted Ser/Thr protein kinase
MKVTITLDEKEQQLLETIYEDRDKDEALRFILEVIRPKVHEQIKSDIKCGNIFSIGGEKK